MNGTEQKNKINDSNDNIEGGKQTENSRPQSQYQFSLANLLEPTIFN